LRRRRFDRQDHQLEFRPLEAPTFREDLTDIVRSDLYTLRRINIVNLPDARLRETLARPWAEARNA
jgi:hypothetical protein